MLCIFINIIQQPCYIKLFSSHECVIIQRTTNNKFQGRSLPSDKSQIVVLSTISTNCCFSESKKTLLYYFDTYSLDIYTLYACVKSEIVSYEKYLSTRIIATEFQNFDCQINIFLQRTVCGLTFHTLKMLPLLYQYSDRG